MLDFWRDLWHPDSPFLLYALVAGVLASIPFGVVGTLVVTRRITAIAGAISHAILGGVGMALYCSRVLGWTFLTPMLGAAIAAVAAALLIGLVSLYASEREDTIIGVVWALGMSVGLLFLAATPGYVDLQGYLFGNILLLSKPEIYWTLGLDALVLVPAVLFYNQLLALSFDACHAELRGLRVKGMYLLLLVLIALTIVLMVNVVGIVLVIALLSLPAATAGCFMRHLWSMMIAAALWCMVLVIAGLAVSYAWNMPTGPVMVVLAAAAYVLALGGAELRGKRR